MSGKIAERSTRHVLDDHLGKRREGRLEEDIARNYSEDVVLLTCTGIFRGHDGVRRSAAELGKYFPGNDFRYRTVLTEGEMGFLEWTGSSPVGEVKDGADSYLIRDGRIVAQTIHYSVERHAPAE